MQSSHLKNVTAAHSYLEWREKEDFQVSLLFMMPPLKKSDNSINALTVTTFRNLALATDPAPFAVADVHYHYGHT